MSGSTKKTLPPDIQRRLDDTKEFDRAAVVSLLELATRAAREVTVSDLWEQPELAMTYWILLMSGTDQEEQAEIAKALLFWKFFNAKDSAMVLCLTLSDGAYKMCADQFKAVKTPTLVMSDTRGMYNYIKIDPNLLFELVKTKGSFQRFITELHLTIQLGDTIQAIKSQLRKERVWAGVKILYSEAKSITSISV